MEMENPNSKTRAVVIDKDLFAVRGRINVKLEKGTNQALPTSAKGNVEMQSVPSAMASAMAGPVRPASALAVRADTCTMAGERFSPAARTTARSVSPSNMLNAPTAYPPSCAAWTMLFVEVLMTTFRGMRFLPR